MRHNLKEGFTTGTTAAAAISGAIHAFSKLTVPDDILIPLPPFCGATPSGYLRVPIADQESDGTVVVIKNGGDDPDVTHGIRILACAQSTPFTGIPAILLEASLPSKKSIEGQSPLQIMLYTGEGIGRVTLPGLGIAIGEAAINPEPRKQIAAAAYATAKACNCTGSIHILLKVPEGRRLAKKTLNGRLGIIGGISILGTHGIVRPYSHEAWELAIEQGISVARASGCTTLFFSTGRRSERILQQLYTKDPQTAFIQAADFAKAALQAGVRSKAAHIVWGCYPGKLLKLAQGLEWTHAHNAPADIPLLLNLLQQCMADSNSLAKQTLLTKLTSIKTASGILALIKEQDLSLHGDLLARLAKMAYNNLYTWMQEAESKGKLPSLCLHVLNLEHEAVVQLTLNSLE